MKNTLHVINAGCTLRRQTRRGGEAEKRSGLRFTLSNKKPRIHVFFPWTHAALLAVLSLFCVFTAGCAGEEDFTSLFNGQDLSGWINVNGAPGTWTVRDGMIVCSGIPTGVLRTTEQYENFILELEWRHLHEGGNAGLFVHSDAITAPGQPFTRSIESQIMDGNHGDMFAIHGATMVPDRPHPQGWMRCLPSEERANPAPEWNHYRVESRDGVLSLAVNGEVVSGGSQISPRKGYICLESEGSEAHFRNIRIMELPSTNPSSDEIANIDVGFVSLYNGIDLSNWRDEAGHEGHWTANNWQLEYDGQREVEDINLWSEKSYRDFVMIIDWRLPEGTEAGGIILRGDEKSQIDITTQPDGSGGISGYRTDENYAVDVRAGVTPKGRFDHDQGRWNRFVITLSGQRLTVMLNDENVIENAILPDIPESGPIGLAHNGAPIQFANLYIIELL